jgi:hypothetical protein
MRALLLLSLLAPAIAAADTTPLSTFPEKPVRYGQAAGSLPAVATVAGSNHTVRVTGGACVIYDPPAYWIDGDAALTGPSDELETRDPAPFGLERLVTRGDTVEIERITASVLYGEIVPSARSRIPLYPVARLDSLTVYAYRWGARIFLVTRSSDTALRRRDGGLGLEEAPYCGPVYTMLRIRNGSSQLAQIQGNVPGTGKPYLIDASVTQTGRDPEPILSVTARLLDR